MKVATALRPQRRTVVLKVRWISGFLLAGVALVVVANVVGGFVQLLTGRQVPVMVDVAREGNLPTWYSSVLIILAAALTALVGKVEKAAGGPHIVHWWGLALVMAWISIDEMLRLHERIEHLIPSWMTDPFGEWIHVHPWVLFGLLFVVLFAIAYLPFLRDLPARTRRWIVGAGLVYVLGAVGGESLHGIINTYYGGGVLTSLANLLEETLEMVGIVIFIHGLLSHLTSEDSGFALRFEA
jgi:hypothetical protein